MMTSTRRHLYLAGFMGTGKSAVGRAVADMLKRPFYDLDAVVEGLTGHSVATIFDSEGESQFRKYEARALRSIVSGCASVISLGGGAPIVPGIARLAEYSGHTVWLTSGWPAVWERVRQDTTRPLLADVIRASDNGGNVSYEAFVARASALYAERELAYETLADWTLDTTALNPADAAQRIVDMMKAAAA